MGRATSCRQQHQPPEDGRDEPPSIVQLLFSHWFLPNICGPLVRHYRHCQGEGAIESRPVATDFGHLATPSEVQHDYHGPSPVLTGYRELVTDLGGNPTRPRRKGGIEPGALNRLTAFIGFESTIDLSERSAAALDSPDFGLRLPERQDIGLLGSLLVAMRYSTAVGKAVGCACKYFHVDNAAIAFTITTGERRGQGRPVWRVQSWPSDGHQPPSMASASPGAS